MELLIELFSEEIPASMQQKAVVGFKDIFTNLLAKEGINFSAITIFTSPRRITIFVSGLPQVIQATELQIKGPKIDAPEQAIEGFCNAHHIKKEDLIKVTIKEQQYFIYMQRIPELEVSKLLENIIPCALGSYVWDKSMYFGEYNLRWVRPLRNILCLFNNHVLPINFAHLTANNLTFGHRFMAPEQIIINNSQQYEQILEENYVIVNHDKRREMIIKQCAVITSELNLIIKDDRDLLNEVVGLVEYPCVMVGKIPEEFMQLPSEVLVTSMRNHQKYFSVFDKHGNFAPYFLFVSNILSNEFKNIISGNEKVLAARLSDAVYFYNQDLMCKLQDRLNELKKISFHSALGSVYDKTLRLQEICNYLSPGNSNLILAAKLCKSDLIANMVIEFPELQGIMGYYYAQAEGINMSVALVIRDHYKPSGLNDIVPTGDAAILAISDKLDSLVGLMLAGEHVTASKDPYALRRQAISIIRIILDNKLQINLNNLVTFAISIYENQSTVSTANIISFLRDRAKFYFKNYYDMPLINAVFSHNLELDLLQTVQDLQFLKDFLLTQNGCDLLNAYKRICNILVIVKKSDNIRAELFNSEYEQNLFEHLVVAEKKLSMQYGNLSFGLSALVSLVKPIEIFFDNILVNDSNILIADNRHALLGHVKKLFDAILKFEHL